MNWHGQAACAGLGTDLFFEYEDASAAKAICARCPVKQACLEEALANREKHGIWGGMTPHERYCLRRKRVRKQLRRSA